MIFIKTNKVILYTVVQRILRIIGKINPMNIFLIGIYANKKCQKKEVTLL